MSENNVNSIDFFELIWTCMSVLGIRRTEAPRSFHWRAIRWAHTSLIISLVTIIFPVHLVIMLFRLPTAAENAKNLSMVVTVISCSAKFFLNIWNIPKVNEMESILQQLDGRVIDKDERSFFNNEIRRNVRNITWSFAAIYFPIGIVAELAYLMRKDHSLMYSAWFPFDWETSQRNYAIANFYQFTGLSLQILQNLCNEYLPAFCLCVASGHTRLLGIRIAKIGHNHPHNYEQNESELLVCIMDQKRVYRLFHVIQEIISWPMFIQIVANIMNIGISLALLLFSAEEPIERLYYVLYSIALPLQIFPTCYYGTYLELCLGRLHHAAFCSNWIFQRPRYKKHMTLFVERTLKPAVMMAGGMLRISVATFFSTCKGAYSVFAVLVQRRN